ncbi:MAG: flagellin [Thermodesulfovibrionales bacterium]|nr:flagellin [Thermodesulfovibrionales bacterium]
MAVQDISLTASMRQNLLNLQDTTKLLSRTQDRLASGKKVNTALDDPVNFFAAQGYMQRAGDLSARKDGMMEGIQIVKAADVGITAMSSLIEQAKAIATSALSTTDTNARAAYATQYNQLMSQITSVARDSHYKGTNLLNNNTLTVKFNEDGSANLQVKGFIATTIQNLTLGFVGDTLAGGSIITWGTTNDAGINTVLDSINTAIEYLRTKSKDLATNLNIITTRQDFTQNMINTLKAGADNLTLADMNEEGANMLMLQTRQSLGITSLSLASQAAQAVLRLF